MTKKRLCLLCHQRFISVNYSTVCDPCQLINTREEPEVATYLDEKAFPTKHEWFPTGRKLNYDLKPWPQCDTFMRVEAINEYIEKVSMDPERYRRLILGEWIKLPQGA